MEQNLLSPEEWAKAVAEYVKKQPTAHKGDKIPVEFTLNENVGRKCLEICLARSDYGPICVCIFLDPKHLTPTKQPSGLLSPADWANAVGQHLAAQSKQHNTNKVTAEFTVTPDERRGCHTICIYITIPPLCYSDC